MDSSKKTSPERADLAARFMATVEAIGELDTGVLASDEPMPSEAALLGAHRLVGGLTEPRSRLRVRRLATMLDELRDLEASAEEDDPEDGEVTAGAA